MKSKLSNLEKGFTVLEIIVVIFIVSLAMVGVLSLVNQNIQVGQFNKSDIIAAQLSQEGLELVRVIRDNNWLVNNPWNQGMGEGQYYIDYVTDALASATGPQPLYIDDYGFYAHTPTASSTPFSRLITISNTTSSSTVVTSEVDWTERGRDRKYVTETILYDWY